MSRLRGYLSRLARKILRRFPALARNSVGRAAIAASRELLQSNPTIPAPSVPPVTSPEPTPQTKTVVENPDALAPPTTAMVHPIRGTECEIVLCCSFTGRHDILQQIIHESTTCNATVRWMLCGSTPEDASFIEMIARQTGVVAGFNCENKPLGRKWQTCVVEATKLFTAETFGIIGSDDFASRRLLDHIAGLIRKEREAEIYTDLYCTLEWLLWIRNDESPLSPNILRCNYLAASAFQPLGSGRFYSARFLESCDGRIFDSRLDRLLDDRGFEEIRSRGGSIIYYSIEDAPLLSVKGNWVQMNDTEDFLKASTLDIHEDSFAGYRLLSESMSGTALRYLARPTKIGPQFHFSDLDPGLTKDPSSSDGMSQPESSRRDIEGP